jgi:tetratricopeptide (TPR) repeat protein
VSLRAPGDPLSSRRPFEQSVDWVRLRPRILAGSGLWFLVAGMLAAFGFVSILLVSFALVLVGGLLAAGLWVLRRYAVREDLRPALRSVERAPRELRARLAEHDLQQRLQGFANVASHRGRGFLAGVRRSSVTVVDRVKAGTSEIRQREPATADLHRHALRLNQLGTQLRRECKHEQAADKHRAALKIMRELGDRRAEALTLNNLALALVHTGSVAIAVQHFEQALAVLRELGEEEHEGRVIANLGFVRRRQGRDEDAESLLHAALDKLPPESSAYRRVEEQLRQAS